MSESDGACPIERRFGALLDAAPDAIVIVDRDGIILLANVHVERVFGYGKGALRGRSVEQLVPKRFHTGHITHRRHFGQHPGTRPMGADHARLLGVRADGSEFPVDISLNPLEIDGQTVVVAAVRDMTARQRTENELREVSEQLERSRAGVQAVLDALDEGVIVFSLEGQVLDANPAALRMHDLQTIDEACRDFRQFINEYHVCTLDGQPLPPDQWPLARVARGENLSNVELEVWRQGAHKHRILSYTGTPVLDRLGKRLFGVCTASDITERKAAEERVRQASLHDPLTGLPNRALLFEYSRHTFARTRRSQRNAAILFIDLDHFKPINDTHGHEAGDAVLQEVARRLRQSTRQEDIVFRLGGDEFLVILPDIHDGAYAAEVARHVIGRLNEPYVVAGLELTLSSSIGISVYPRDGQDIDTLINLADVAMYHAKHSGRNRHQFYSTALTDKVNAQARIEAQLRTALMHEQFRLCYQPVVDMKTEQVIAVEALLRWPDDSVGPDRFIPVAEATGLIGRVGQWVVAEACRQHNSWIERGLPAIPIAVNVSAVQFRQTDVVEQFAQAISKHSVGADALQLELTETALIDNIEQAIAQLLQMKSLGVKIALDDFGTGYSSLSYLSRLPIDKIKVDKSFVYRIESDPASRTITDAIIALGKTLHLEIVAEGIESADVLSYLSQHGCTQAQGYHVCRPIEADVFESWYRERGWH